MKEINNFIKDITYKILIVIISLIFVLLIVNFLIIKLSKKQNIPRQFAGTLTNYLFTYYPDTFEDSSINDYTAILGDSNAMGSGDAYLNGSYEYSIGHFLHKKNSKSYLNYARGGFGSLSSVSNYLKLIKLEKYNFFKKELNPPSEILFFFYEGNDLDENLKEYEINLKKFSTIKDYVNFKINKRIKIKKKDIIDVNFPILEFLRSIKFQFKDLLDNIIKSRNFESIYNNILIRIKKIKGENVILANKDFLGSEKKFFWTNKTLDGRLFEIRPIEAAAPDLNKLQKDTSLSIFFESLLFLKKNNKKAKIKIIFLPSPATSYEWSNPIKYLPRYSKKKLDYREINYKENLENNLHIVKKIELFSKQNNFEFVDLTKKIQNKTKSTILHGPLDWVHFNLKGYEFISNSL